MTTIETKTMFDFTDKQLKEFRQDGLKHIMLSGAYYYQYDDVINYLMEEVWEKLNLEYGGSINTIISH